MKDPFPRALLTVLTGLSSLDHAARKQAYTLLDTHERTVWVEQLALHGDPLLRVRHPRLCAVGGAVLFVALLPAALLLHALGWALSSRGIALVAGDALSFATRLQAGFRRVEPAQVEALLARVGEDRRLVPLLLAHLPPARSVRAAWLARLARLLPEWYQEESSLPHAAHRILERELRHFAGRETHAESEVAFLVALLVSLDREMAGERLRPELEALARRGIGSRVAEGARLAIQRLERG